MNNQPPTDGQARFPSTNFSTSWIAAILLFALATCPTRCESQTSFASPYGGGNGRQPSYQYPASGQSFQNSGVGLQSQSVFSPNTAAQQVFQVPQQQLQLPQQFQSPTPQPQQLQQLQQLQQQQLQQLQLQQLQQQQLQRQQFQQPGFNQPATGQSFFQQNGLQQQNGFQQPGVLDLDVTVPQVPSGKFSLGGTYGSDNGFVGQFIIDEKDFSIRSWPRNLQDITSGRAWRGNGEHFRAEIVPGNEVERYLVSWSNPYFRNSDYSLSVSGYLFDRQYFDWDEKRVGGRVNVGRNLSQFLSINAGLRMESVTIDNPRVGTSAQLNSALGNSNLFLGHVGLVYDTRLYPYLTGVGSYLSLKYSQAFGDYSYARGEIDFRNYRTIYQRPDTSGRHTIEFRTKLGFTGGSTPVFENFIAGGMTSMRGFEFRGISPIEGGVRVGGEFQWLNSLEYKFPLTQDDMIHGVMFVDFGTVEESVELNSDNFRVAPGIGLRVHLPYAGMAAPLSFDFAFPVDTATGDNEQSFGFLIGLMR